MKRTKRSFSFYLMIGFLMMTLALSAQTVQSAQLKQPSLKGYSIYEIKLSPASPATLKHNQKVNISFRFRSLMKDIYIWARPMTGKSTSPNYTASPSQLYSTNSGVGKQYFTITTGDVKVDKIRFQIYDKSKTKLLYQKFIDVKFRYPTCLPIARIIKCAISGASGDTSGKMTFTWSFDPPPRIKPYKLLLTVYRKQGGSWINIMPNLKVFTVNPPSSTSATIFTSPLYGEYKVHFEAFYTCNRIRNYTFYLNF